MKGTTNATGGMPTIATIRMGPLLTTSGYDSLIVSLGDVGSVTTSSSETVISKRIAVYSSPKSLTYVNQGKAGIVVICAPTVYGAEKVYKNYRYIIPQYSINPADLSSKPICLNTDVDGIYRIDVYTSTQSDDKPVESCFAGYCNLTVEGYLVTNMEFHLLEKLYHTASISTATKVYLKGYIPSLQLESVLNGGGGA